MLAGGARVYLRRGLSRGSANHIERDLGEVFALGGHGLYGIRAARLRPRQDAQAGGPVIVDLPAMQNIHAN